MNSIQLLQYSKWDNYDKFIKLCDKYTNLDIHDDDGMTPLLWCAATGNIKLLKFILYSNNKNYNINFKNNKGNTALHEASSWGYDNIVELLLQHNSSPFIVNNLDMTPLDVSFDCLSLSLPNCCNHIEVIYLLKKYSMNHLILLLQSKLSMDIILIISSYLIKT